MSTDYRDRLATLARSFPTLRAAEGLEPWDPETFHQWVWSHCGSGGRHAALFVLSVFNYNAEWDGERFSVVHAMAVWDESHREAFRTWARDPWNA